MCNRFQLIQSKLKAQKSQIKTENDLVHKNVEAQPFLCKRNLTVKVGLKNLVVFKRLSDELKGF